MVEAERETSSRLATLRAVRDLLTTYATTDEPAELADRVNLLRLTEEIAGAACAVQLAEVTRFARRFTAAEIDRCRNDREFDPLAVKRSIVSQVGLACRVSPWEASRRLNAGRALTQHLPRTFAALAEGRISPPVAEKVVAATNHLDGAGQQTVDAELVGKLDGRNAREADQAARAKAYEHDPAAFVARGRHAREDRRVGLRPAPDTMSVLTGYLPVEQGVGCLAALRKHADALKAGGDSRSRDQLMADTLVERLTGQARAADVNIELQLLMPIETLTAEQSNRAVTLAGFGILPGETARDILLTGNGRRWWRRLFTGPDPADPSDRTVVGGDRRPRRFDRHIRRLIEARDQHCRMPFCDAQIRAIDHIFGYARGGRSVLDNGEGLCTHHNLSKEAPGWHVIRISANKIRITSPTRHSYLTRAPDPP